LFSLPLFKNTNIKICVLIILHVVLYGCETWSLILREKHRLRVFENRVPRKILEPKANEITRNWKKLHNWKLYDLYSSTHSIRVKKLRRMIWEGHVAYLRERKGAYGVLVRKPERNRPLGRPRSRCEDNVTMKLEETG
jgi:hypothetical protein